jgi:tetratricopeptide (TPR) repeat protein
MIMQLEKEGKLKLDDPLSKFLSMYPEETGSKITIDYLLNMKAGLGDYLQDPEFNKNPYRFKTINDFLDMIKIEPLLFEPGTSERYSNSGYVVLGGIIEKVTGKSYEENLKERILEPYGMNNTYFMRYDDNIPNTAISAYIDFSGKKTNAPFHASPSPAGGIYTNISDMQKFYKGLKESKVLKENFIIAGGTNTWNSIMGHYKNGYTLIILGNFGRMADEIENRFRTIIKGEPYTKPAPPVEMEFFRVFNEKGMEYFKEHIKDILKEYKLLYNDMHLNMFGYKLMEQNNIDLAIDVFKLNTELFPDIPNVWDSLAEAYMKKGNTKLAIENYKKVLEMDPNNQNAKKMVEQLENK